ncbi:MAG: hypothetical protein M0P13_02710 [Fibrobacteraceae bacterium]|nr:hypothetical protein [Fibrobacteraceae bacterium]
MNTFKTLFPAVLFISLASFVGCGSVDHDPPKIKTTFGQVSPMDTLVVEFDKDLDDFDDSLVSSNVPITVVKQSGSKVYIVGATDTLAGLPSFEAASSFDSLKFVDISDEDGNTEEKVQSVTFSTYPFLDKDVYKGTNCKTNNYPVDADVLTDSSSTTFFTNVKVSKGVTFAGVLGGVQHNKNCFDERDYFRIFLKKNDILSIQLSTGNKNVPLYLAVLGPTLKDDALPSCGVDDNKEFISLTGTSLDSNIVIGEIHDCGTNMITDYLAYYIRVGYSESLTSLQEVAVPYKMTITISR